MPDRILLFHTYGALEWATSYWLNALATPGDSITVAGELADAEAPMLHSVVTINRFELLDAGGNKVYEGALNVPGLSGGEMMPIHYAMFLRFNSSGGGRPSTKYLHGFPEAFTTTTGITSTGATAVATYAAALLAVSYQVQDSDGSPVIGVTFRSFSRRRRMRRATT